MRETVSLLVMWAGIAIAMYGVGMPIGWVVVVLAVLFIVGYMLLRPKKKGAVAEKARVATQGLKAPSIGGGHTNGKPSDGPKQEPERQRISIIPMPANQGHDGTSARPVIHERADSRAITPDPRPHDTGQANIITPPVGAKQKGGLEHSNSIEVAQPRVDPLDRYRLEQFDDSARPAPVEAFMPKAAPARTSTPIGPAWEAPKPSAPKDQTQRVPTTPRPIPQPLKPEDFQRNAGQRGFLYLARNPEHWTGLFKVGQTIHHPSRRVAELNKQHAKHKDIGQFDLLDVVEVFDAYGAEQVLFKVLNDLRPVSGREFFIADQGHLSMTMRAVADFVQGRPDELNRIYRELDPKRFNSWPGRVPWYRHHGVARAKGWVYLARNQYHLADTYLFGATSGHPESALKELNEGQRTETPQIGFYTVVFTLPVFNTISSRTIGWRALSPWKLKGSRSYIRGPLLEISKALSDSLGMYGK